MRLLMRQQEKAAVIAAACISSAFGSIEVVLDEGEILKNCESPPQECQYLNHRYFQGGKCNVILQGRGNLLVRDAEAWEYIWSSGFTQSATEEFYVRMQRGGNLVIYGPSGAVWATNSGGNSEHVFLGIEDDCRLSIFKGQYGDGENAEVIWTNIRDGLMAGGSLQKGEIAHDKRMGVFWILQHDGNFVAYKDAVDVSGTEVYCGKDYSKLWNCIPTDAPVDTHQPLWSSGTAGTFTGEDNGWVYFRHTGKLQLLKERTPRGSGHTVQWASEDLVCDDFSLGLDVRHEPVALC